MYEILEQMLDATEKKEIEKLKELDKSFESLLSPLERRTELDYEYDNCRQSCIMTVQALCSKKEKMYNMFIKDARERFDKIRQKRK